jgi:hypothetical protein
MAVLLHDSVAHVIANLSSRHGRGALQADISEFLVWFHTFFFGDNASNEGDASDQKRRDQCRMYTVITYSRKDTSSLSSATSAKEWGVLLIQCSHY